MQPPGFFVIKLLQRFDKVLKRMQSWMLMFNIPFVSVSGSQVEWGIGVTRKKKELNFECINHYFVSWSQNFFSDPFNTIRHNKATKIENISSSKVMMKPSLFSAFLFWVKVYLHKRLKQYYLKTIRLTIVFSGANRLTWLSSSVPVWSRHLAVRKVLLFVCVVQSENSSIRTWSSLIW